MDYITQFQDLEFDRLTKTCSPTPFISQPQWGDPYLSLYLGNICDLQDPWEVNLCRWERKNVEGAFGCVTNENRTATTYVADNFGDDDFS